MREIHSDPAVMRILGKAMPPTEVAEWVPTDEPGECNGSMAADVTRRRALDAAFQVVFNAMRDRPDEVGAAVGRRSAEHGPDRINRVLDAVERRLSVKSGIRCRLP